MDNILIKLKELMREQNITIYRMTEITGLSENTIYNWYNKGAEPSIHALRAICKVLDISLAELFAEKDEKHFTLKEHRLVEHYRKLSNNQKDIIESLLKEFEGEG